MKRILRLCQLWGKCLVIDTKIYFATTLDQLRKCKKELEQIDRELEEMGLPKRGEIL